MAKSLRILVLASLGCGPAVGVDSTSEDPASTGGGTTGAPSTSTSSSSTSPPTTTLPPDQTSGSREPDAGIVPADVYAEDCSFWDQDCPPGQKCMPYSTNGETWNATRCSPVAPDPAATGESCTVEDDPLSGVDSCDGTSMCWNVDLETLEGTCVAFCVGNETDPTCSEPGFWCAISADTVVPLCFGQCDPIEQDCPPGEGCYPVQAHFTCMPDASGTAGAYGEPCEFVNVCDPGLQCVDAAAVPDCRGIGCCSPTCNLDDPGPCPGEGQSCLPWFAPGEATPGYEQVGVCGVPS